MLCLMQWLVKSAIVSKAVLKMGELFVQPMGSTRGKAISGSLPSIAGKIKPNLGKSSGPKSTCRNHH